MSDDQKKEECVGCIAIMSTMSWAFSHVDRGGAVICTTCGKRHEQYLNSMPPGTNINSPKQ
jgi:hypothetical protein